MRLTIKMKLALAPSIVSGRVGYSRLAMLKTTLDGIASAGFALSLADGGPDEHGSEFGRFRP